MIRIEDVTNVLSIYIPVVLHKKKKEQVFSS